MDIRVKKKDIAKMDFCATDTSFSLQANLLNNTYIVWVGAIMCLMCNYFYNLPANTCTFIVLVHVQ